MKIIFHIDINSYFATMLQQENPRLRGKPVGVIKDVGRTCIIAASKEAKKLGVSTGARVPEARQKIPNLILVPAQFDLMLSATRKLKEVFAEFSPIVHIFSLDEVFLDLTGCENLFKTLPHCHPGKGGDEEPYPGSRDYSNQNGSSTQERFASSSRMTKRLIIHYARLIQSRIKEVLGSWVTCNVGISYNKLLAKMAGEIAPKGEVLIIDGENVDEILSTIEFKDVCGVGWGLQKKLHLLGIRHPYQINLVDDRTLLSVFGPHWSQELRKIGKGEETHFFTHKRSVTHQQSVGRTITGYRLTDDEGEIKRVLLNLLEEATHKLRAMNLSGRKIGISLWGRESYWGEYRTLKYWVRHTREIWDLLYEGMYRRWDRTFPIIKFGVWIGDCKPTQYTDQNLLPEWQKNEKVYKVIDQVNDRFGSFSLMPATMLGGRVIRPEVTGYLGDRVYLGL